VWCSGGGGVDVPSLCKLLEDAVDDEDAMDADDGESDELAAELSAAEGEGGEYMGCGTVSVYERRRIRARSLLWCALLLVYECFNSTMK